MSLLLDLPGLALAAGCLVLGLGLSSGGPPWLTFGERLVIGMVLAIVGLTMVGYGLALLVGVGMVLVLLLTAFGLLAGGYLLWRHRPKFRAELVPRGPYESRKNQGRITPPCPTSDTRCVKPGLPNNLVRG